MKRIDSEKVHGLRIAHNAENIWGWDTPAGRIRAERRANEIISLAHIVRDNVILELGSGTGVFTQKFAEIGCKLIATDIVLGLLKQTLDKPESIGNRPLLVVADVHMLPFKGSTFDIVVGSSILHHLNLTCTLKEIKRVLKHDGKIAFAEPNMLNPQVILQKNIPILKRWSGDSPDETAFFRWQIKTLLEKCGFKGVAVTPYDFLHPRTPNPFISIITKIGTFLEKIPVVREIAGSLLIYGRLERKYKEASIR